MKLYIAGPDVFRPDVVAWAAEVRALCAEFQCQALIPIDGSETTAAGIFRNNLRLIGESDIVVANLNPFRGSEPDSGTCVEVGYALALRKRVVGYLDSLEPLHERMAARGGSVAGEYRDAAGWLVENFGLPLNLMLAVPVGLIKGNIRDCLAHLTAGRQASP